MSIHKMILASVLAVMMAAHAKAEQTLTILVDEWPPFSGVALPNRGMSVDVITSVLTRAGYQVEASIMPWARIMSIVKTEDFDVIGSLFFDPDVTQYITYSEPFFSTDVQLVRRVGDNHEYTSVQALEPFSIAVGAGFLYQDEFDAAAYLNKVEVTTTLQALRMLGNDRVDLTLDSIDVINFALTKEDTSLAQSLEFAPGVMATHGIHMGVSNGLPNRDAIVSDFNRVLADMAQDGSLAKIIENHTQ